MPQKKVLVDLDFNNVAKGINHPDPVSDTDVANKRYVDSVAQGLNVKGSVRVASDGGNVAIATAPAAIDGITLSNGERVLLKDQSAPIENGIYVFNGVGVAMTRSTDFAAGDNARSVFLFVEEGTVNEDTGWVCTSDAGADVVGTDPLTFTQFSGAGSIIAGDALGKTGNTLFVKVDGTTIEIAGDQLQLVAGVSFTDHKSVATIGNGVASSFIINHGLNAQSVVVSIRDTGTNEHVIADVVCQDANNITVSFNDPPTSNQFEVTIIG